MRISGRSDAEVAVAKRVLREQQLAVRKRRSATFRREACEQIRAAVLAHLVAPRVNIGVALYWPMLDRGELDLRELVGELSTRGVPVFLPRMFGKDASQWDFAYAKEDSDLERHALGFWQPAQQCVPARSLGFVVVPALAVTPTGSRLGYGAGFYDRMLGRYAAAVSICAVFDDEVVPAVPTHPHDRACNVIVTERRSILC